MSDNPVVRAAKWVAGEVWEKINLPAVWRELKELGKKHGKRFFWAALIWECVEDGLFPLLSWWFGMPELIPLFLIFHFEPIAYPAIFWMFRIWDRKKGVVPEHPERSVYSTSWRAWLKAVNFNIPVLGFLGWVGGASLALPYAAMMLVFYFVHDRIWHDSNYGIRADDTVEFRRCLAKTATYRIVALMVMYPLMKITGGVDWAFMGLWHLGAAVAFLGMELVWSKSVWGLEINPDVGTPPPWSTRETDEILIRTPFGTRLNKRALGEQLFPVQPLPDGALPIYDNEPPMYEDDTDIKVGGTD